MFSRMDGFWSGIAEPTGKLNQRENWYVYNYYIGEFWCAITSIPLIFIGIYYRCIPIAFAGTASLVSHAVPLKIIHIIDLFGVAVVICWVIIIIPKTTSNIIKSIILGGINMIDMWVSRNWGLTYLHIVWHLMVAYFVWIFLEETDLPVE